VPFPPELTVFDCDRLENAYPLFRDTGLVRALKNAINRIADLENSSNEEFACHFNARIKVPAAGILYLRNGGAATSAAPFVAMQTFEIVSISLRVDKIDLSRDYDVVAYINGTPTILLTLSASLSNSLTGLTVNIPNGASLAIALVKSSGSGSSTFRKIAATIILRGI